MASELLTDAAAGNNAPVPPFKRTGFSRFFLQR